MFQQSCRDSSAAQRPAIATAAARTQRGRLSLLRIAATLEWLVAVGRRRSSHHHHVDLGPRHHSHGLNRAFVKQRLERIAAAAAIGASDEG